MDPEEITICKRPDGSDQVLGTGSSGKVRRCGSPCFVMDARQQKFRFAGQVSTHIMLTPFHDVVAEWTGKGHVVDADTTCGRCTRRCGAACCRWR